jgi:hypothetical protein
MKYAAWKKGAVVMVGGLSLLVLLFIFPCLGSAQIPRTINHQGYLTSAGGAPVQGAVNMTFRVYGAPSGGTALWTETQSVEVDQGVYSVNLGEVTPLGLPFNVPYYLGISIGADAEMAPRKVLTSVGYATRALTVDTVPSHGHSGADITSGTVAEPRIDAALARTSALTAHTSRTDNPHGVTAAQVGAALVSHNHDAAYVNVGEANSVTTGMITDGTISAADLANSSVTKPKLSASGGTSGQVLGTDGTNLIWQTPSFPGMPGIEFLSSTASGVPTTITSYGSLVITAPTAGYVLVQVSGYAVTFGQNTVVEVGIGDSTDAFDFYTSVGVLDGSDTLRREFSLNVTGVYSVSAGAKTIYLLAQKPSVFSAQWVNLGNLFMSAIFFPNRY